MKRNKKFIILALCLAMMVSFAGCGGTSSNSGQNGSGEGSVEPIYLRASSGFAYSHSWQKGFYEPLLEAVAEKTDGMITYDIFTGGELVALTGEYDALRSNTIDIALSLTPMFDPARFPLTEVTMLPLIFIDTDIATEAFYNMMNSDREIADGKSYYDLEFTDNGLVAFVAPATEPYTIATRDIEFKTVADFNSNVRMRTPSRAMEMFSNNLGLTPITLPSNDVYDALSRGSMEGIYTCPDWINIGISEFLGNVITGGFGVASTFISMTTEKWESLPVEVRDAFIEAYDYQVKAGTQAWKDYKEACFAELDELGHKVTPLDELNPEVQDHISKAVVASWTSWIDNLEGQGLPGKEMAILWRDMVVEAGGIVPDEVMAL